MTAWVRGVLLVVLIAVVVVVLFTTVFPWVERTLEQDPTVAGEVPVHLAASPGPGSPAVPRPAS